MRLHRLDLNLLIALDALLATHSVTAAARRLHVTQPSMSGSLARLREHFGDALLVPAGRGLQLTPFAELLATSVRHAMEGVQATAELRPTFEPATSRRHFRLSASEATVATLLSDALHDVGRQAPGVTVELLPTDAGAVLERLQRRDLDIAFYPERYLLHDHPHALAMEDDFVCVAWSGNRRIGRRLTLERYLELPHVVTRYGFERRPGFEQWHMEQAGIRRHETIGCSSPVAASFLVAHTERLATLPRRLARQQAAHLPLRILPPPPELGLQPLRIFMQWHQGRAADGGIAWLGGLVHAAAAQGKTAAT